MAQVGQDMQLGWVVVLLVDGLGLYRSVGRKDVVVLSVDKEDRHGFGCRRKSGGHCECATTGNDGGWYMGERGQGVEEGHGALRETEEGDVDGGNAVGSGDLSDEVIELGRDTLQAVFVAEGPAGIAEPLAAKAIGGGGRCVRGIDGQTFAEVTERCTQGGGEGDKVVARGTKAV